MNSFDRRLPAATTRASLLASSTVLLMLPVAAQAQGQNAGASPERVVIVGEKPNYKADAPDISKLTEVIIDTPQTINVVTEQVLKDQAVTNLNDALKNVPGITIGAGEFRSMGNTPTIRGFVARTDMFLDGLRDFGNYYRDPFNLEEIQVLEGPSSVLFGRGSTGGVIEQVSKQPHAGSAISGSVMLGTDQTRRATFDINEPIDGLGTNAAFRVAGMVHDANVTGRDVVEAQRFGFAPSLALGLGTPTRVVFDYFHQTANDIPDYGLPYFGATPAAVPRHNFYGFASDYDKTGTDIGTIKVEHDFADGISVNNQLRYAYYTRDFRFSEPLIATTIPLSTPLSAVNVIRNVNIGRAVDTMLWDQANAITHFDTGDIGHSLVLGMEGGHETSKPKFYNNTGVPSTPLLTPDEGQAFTATTTFARFATNTKLDSFGIYAIDTLHIGRQWDITGGLRWDYIDTDYKDINYSITTPGLIVDTDHIPRTDSFFSYRAAVVYKPVENGSVYFTVGNSSNPSSEEESLIVSSRSFKINNAFLDPEKNQTYELGTKWELLNKNLLLTASVFRLEKINARVPDPTNTNLNTLDGGQRVDGFEIDITGRITENWQIIAGYSYLDSQITTNDVGAAPKGSPLMNTPKNALKFWTTYYLGGGFEIGAGGRYVDSQFTQNVPPIKTVPSYWDFDAMAKYQLSEKWSLQLNVNNIFDKYYYDQLHFFHVVPGEGRTAFLSVNFTY